MDEDQLYSKYRVYLINKSVGNDKSEPVQQFKHKKYSEFVDLDELFSQLKFKEKKMTNKRGRTSKTPEITPPTSKIDTVSTSTSSEEVVEVTNETSTEVIRQNVEDNATTDQSRVSMDLENKEIVLEPPVKEKTVKFKFVDFSELNQIKLADAMTLFVTKLADHGHIELAPEERVNLLSTVSPNKKQQLCLTIMFEKYAQQGLLEMNQQDYNALNKNVKDILTFDK